MDNFRIANCNAANFNYPGVRYAGRAGADGAPLSQANYDHKVKWLAGLMDTAMVDLVGFEELFHRQAITDVVTATARFANATVYAPNLEDNVANGEARGPFCGLVTRFPIVSQAAISQFPGDVAGKLLVQRSDGDRTTIDVGISQFQRPVLRVQVKLRPHVTATVFVAHLKSKREQYLAHENTEDPVVQALGNARSLIIRAAEAAALRSLVVAAMSGNNDPVIVLGDLNDEPTAATTQILHGPPGSEIGTDGYTTPDQGDGARLWNLFPRIQPPDNRYSRIYRGNHELIDHILASHLVTHHVADGDVTAGLPAVPTASIDDNPAARRNTPASDHRPLVVTIDL